jgi:hypothetical protein
MATKKITANSRNIMPLIGSIRTPIPNSEGPLRPYSEDGKTQLGRT